jgi:benzodiazapine receptor
MKMNSIYIIFIIFLALNFGALGLGGFLMDTGPSDAWYAELNKAPWTPPGWVFGVAWTTIMLCFSVYMTVLYERLKRLKAIGILFAIQWVLNVSWNLAFFNLHSRVIGLIIIVLLWLLIGYFTFKYLKSLKLYTLLIVPYLIWLTIATSLNAYIVLYN